MNPASSSEKPALWEAPPWERVVDAFEAAWQSGTPPALEQFWPPADAAIAANAILRRELLEELVKIDLEYRWRLREKLADTNPVSSHAETRSPAATPCLPACPRLEDYRSRYPDLGPTTQWSVDLIGEEYRVRQQWGDRPDHAEYQARFPEHGPELQEVLARADTERLAESAGRAGTGTFASLAEANPVTIVSGPSLEGPCAIEGPNLPDYEIVRELGQGGMGVVYAARQRSLDRLVALKVVRAGSHASRGELARFRAEAEAVARLQHPHIVHIYEVGEHAGAPYFSLEYLPGGNLAQQLGGTPQPARAAARLVEILARAVHFAHEHGVVHRDLKPANVLLTVDGVPKITDFGLAKRLDKETGQTQTGIIMGTPSYMAAEQAAGKTREIGPPADIYGLGAILYEMVTGRPPFKGETTLDTIQQVLYVEPVSPLQLQPKLPRDLETICMKCLQKVPSHRYASALTLAEDLRRFLAGEPILARPVSAWERTLKWARRRPAVAALLMVSGLAIVSLLSGGIWYNAQLQEAKQAAETRREEAERDRAIAAANFQKARDAVDAMLTEVGEKQLAQIPQMEPVRRALLEKALHFYQGFLQEQSTDPAVRRETARAYQRTGAIYEMLWQHGEAEEALRQALHLLGQLAEQFPEEPVYRQDQAKVYVDLGNLYRETAPPAQAEETYQKALTIQQQLVRAHPDVAGYKNDLATGHVNLGSFYGRTGRLNEAEPHLKEALTLREQLHQEHPDIAEYESGLGKSYTNLGNLYLLTNRPEQAEKAYRQGRAVLEHLTQRWPEVAQYQDDLAGSNNNLGYLYASTGRPQEARAPYQKALEIRAELVRAHPKQYSFAVGLGETSTNLANLVRDLGEPEASLPRFAQAAKAVEAALQQAGPTSTQRLRMMLRNVYWGRGQALTELHRFTEAIADWDQALSFDDGSGRAALRLLRALSAAHLGKHGQARAEADAVVATPQATPEALYQAASIYALSAAAVRQEKGLAPTEAQQRAESYAARAVELLTKAAAAGLFNRPEVIAQMKADANFAALRAREDFQRWLATLETKQKP